MHSCNVKLGLLDKLYAAKHQLEREEARAKTVENIPRAFMNLVEAQTGKHIKDEAVNMRARLIELVFNSLPFFKKRLK